jgi:chemotaxis signal transduction protein
LPASDARGRPILSRELGPLLDPSDQSVSGRRHALTLVLRRRTVALLVARAESLAAFGPWQPLGPLLTPRLARPWVLGAVVIADQPVLVLDLRRIAADLALGVV